MQSLVVHSLLLIPSFVFIYNKSTLQQQYSWTRKLNRETKDRWDPTRVVINQFLRIFSGRILVSMFGLGAVLLRTPILFCGMLINLINSALNLWIASPNISILSTKSSLATTATETKKYHQRTLRILFQKALTTIVMATLTAYVCFSHAIAERPVYTLLTSLVLFVSLHSLALFTCGIRTLSILGIPSSLIGGLVAFCAELFDQIREAKTYIQALKSPQHTLDALIKQKHRLKKRQHANFISLITTSLSWFPVLAGTKLLLKIGDRGLQLLGLMGIGTAITHFYVTTKQFYQKKIFTPIPTNTPEKLKASSLAHYDQSIKSDHKKLCSHSSRAWSVAQACFIH